MKNKIGLWLDHEKAVIISMKNGNVKIAHIESGAESQLKDIGGSRTTTPYSHQDVSNERALERRRKNQLHKYYQKIIHSINSAYSVFIFGPGNAKIELEKELKKNTELAAINIDIKTADNMTENQMIAKVRKFYRLPK